MTSNDSAARLDEAGPGAQGLERPPVVTTMPRLGRGVVWRDIVREIEQDEFERAARLRDAA